MSTLHTTYPMIYLALSVGCFLKTLTLPRRMNDFVPTAIGAFIAPPPLEKLYFLSAVQQAPLHG